AVAVDFSDAITIIVSRPLALALAGLPMLDRRMLDAGLDFHSCITLPFVGVEDFDISANRRLDDFQTGFGIRTLLHRVTNFSTLAPFDRKDWRAIRLIVSVTAAFVGPSARRVLWVTMRLAFFPRRSGTTHRLPEPDLSKASLDASPIGVVAPACESCASADDPSPIRETSERWAHLWQCRVRSSGFSRAVAEFSQRPFLSIKSNSDHAPCNDKPSSSHCVERFAFQLHRSEDISILLGEDVLPTTWHMLLRPTACPL